MTSRIHLAFVADLVESLSSNLSRFCLQYGWLVYNELLHIAPSVFLHIAPSLFLHITPSLFLHITPYAFSLQNFLVLLQKIVTSEPPSLPPSYSAALNGLVSQ